MMKQTKTLSIPPDQVGANQINLALWPRHAFEIIVPWQSLRKLIRLTIKQTFL